MGLESGSRISSQRLRGDSGVGENNCRGVKTVRPSSELPEADSDSCTADAAWTPRGLASVSKTQRLHMSSRIIVVGCIRQFTTSIRSPVDIYLGSSTSRILFRQCTAPYDFTARISNAAGETEAKPTTSPSCSPLAILNLRVTRRWKGCEAGSKLAGAAAGYLITEDSSTHSGQKPVYASGWYIQSVASMLSFQCDVHHSTYGTTSLEPVRSQEHNYVRQQRTNNLGRIKPHLADQ